MFIEKILQSNEELFKNIQKSGCYFYLFTIGYLF